MFKQFHTSKPQSLLVVCHPTLLKHPFMLKSLGPFNGICKKIQTHYFNCLLNPRKGFIPFNSRTAFAKNWNLELSMNFSYGFRPKCAISSRRLISVGSFSGLDNGKVAEGSEKNLPWLAKEKAKQTKRPGKFVVTRSSSEESAEKFLNEGVKTEEFKRNEDRPDAYQGRNNSVEGDDREEMEVVDDPRWDKIKNRFNQVKVKPGYDRPEVRRWNKQDSWGKKTWKEATESSIPRMGGGGVYGVGPVLAALSAGRREFYALYVQEGLDLSGNNRKKKDKKGFEKVLSMAENFCLSIKEVSKHDLNMISDNRPHQGLVLDASPLEMVGIKELEPVSSEEESIPLWVALDEVTDPQNLGAIIRSAYFFGASGVVLCAKNSAPLSGVVSKASAGSLELMEMRSCKNMMQFLTCSSENGWRVLGGSISSRAVPLCDIVPGAPTILVLGSEGTGLRPLVERSCTDLVKIPGNIPVDIIAGEDEDALDANRDHSVSGHNFRSFMAVESLNVSVAAGVLIHHLAAIIAKTTNKNTI